MSNLIKNNPNKPSNKISFAQRKEKTICSLYEVEHFLNDFKKIVKTLKLYKILK